MKRGALGSEDAPSAKKRSITYSTFLKWKGEFDKEFQTRTWLNFALSEGVNPTVVALKCSVCTKFEHKIETRRNYSDAYIYGAESLRTSGIRDHAKSDQHVYAMALHKQEQAKSSGLSVTMPPVVELLTKIDKDTKDKLRIKFDVANFVALEKLAFSKYEKICSLEAKHGINIGSAYLNETACKTFCSYIAKVKTSQLADHLSKVKFFSVLMDGTTDRANVEDEAFLAVWCDANATDEKIHTRMSLISIARPQIATAAGLYTCLQDALKVLGISSISSKDCKRLVGIGTDGAAVNVSSPGGLRGLVEKEVNWVFWMWCLAHRLELAVKDALKESVFADIDEMLLRLYYIYEKSPKKCRELEEVATALRSCLHLDGGGIRPIRASGTRWITHKVNAMQRILGNFGVYISHLTGLTQDKSVKSIDRAKLQGYVQKWINAKYILGCAFFLDLLKPCVTMSKVMQRDDLDILRALTSLVRTVKEVKILSSKPLDDWEEYSDTLKKIEDGNGSYQEQAVQRLDEAKAYFVSHCPDLCRHVTDCLTSRLQWTEFQLIEDIIFVLATQGWEKILVEINHEAKQDILAPLERLGIRFNEPLEAAGVQLKALKGEFKEVLEYANQYISLATLEYTAVWWRVFHSPDAESWCNLTMLAQLLFALPVSNGKLERVFSELKAIKVERRASLSNETLNNLLIINTDPVPFEDFNPDPAIQMWWDDKVRRTNQKHRSSSTGGEGSTSQVPSDSIDDITLDDWDEWILQA